MSYPPSPLPLTDLESVLERTRTLWPRLRGAKILVTGGTGFFGQWMVQSFALANEIFDLGASLTIFARNPAHPARFAIGDLEVAYLAGDVRNPPAELQGFDYIVHAAGTSTLPESPLETMETIVDGTKRILEAAKASRSKGVLFTSSGAVYGRSAPLHVSEDDLSAPSLDTSASAYAEAKRLAELICTIQAEEAGLPVKIARCFAFVGPGLPLNAHFAVGNFLRDGLAGGPIKVGGDGTPLRSYMYAADLCVWLWKILLDGQPARPYNVGSPDEISIGGLAHRVKNLLCPNADVEIATQSLVGSRPHTYVPSVLRAQEELGLKLTITLDEAIERTAAWNGGRR